MYLFFREFKLIKEKEFVYHASVFFPVAFLFLLEGCPHRKMLVFVSFFFSRHFEILYMECIRFKSDIIDCVAIQWIKNYKALQIKQTAWLPGALTELEVIYYCNSGALSLLITKAPMSQVPECVSGTSSSAWLALCHVVVTWSIGNITFLFVAVTPVLWGP